MLDNASLVRPSQKKRKNKVVMEEEAKQEPQLRKRSSHGAEGLVVELALLRQPLLVGVRFQEHPHLVGRAALVHVLGVPVPGGDATLRALPVR